MHSNYSTCRCILLCINLVGVFTTCMADSEQPSHTYQNILIIGHTINTYTNQPHNKHTYIKVVTSRTTKIY